ncbi:MAG: proton-conducting transporter membrane subunit, partial [Alphaproteobacteria bacterium]|nr:proton-conducting transporter membrane subunit [Alphaproteobacteria bacterium]
DLSTVLLNQQDTTLITVGVVLITIAFMFKLGAAPLHYWLPDIYQGTKLTITTLIATTPKFAALILMGRIFSHMLSDFADIWQPILFAFAVMSLLMGTMGAYVQTNIKRFLAYSSTMNIGFVLAAMATFSAHGYGASILYMSIYMMTLITIFASFMVLKKRNYDIADIADLKGISEKYPYVGFVICLCFLSLAGLPPLPGFISKLYVLYALLLDDHYIIAAITVISTVIACAYYLNILKSLIIDSIDKVFRTYKTKHTGMVIKIVVIFLLSVLLLVLVMPSLWIQFFHKAAIDLLH